MEFWRFHLKSIKMKSNFFKKNDRVTLRNGARLRIAAANRYDCPLCHERLGAQFHIDHIVALCNGGDNSLGNLQAICANCHAEKTSIDTQKYWDKRCEVRTGVSRFFNPLAYEYLGNVQSKIYNFEKK